VRVFSCGELDFIFPQQLRELNPGGHSVNSGAVLYDLTHIPSTLLAAACAIAAQPSLHDVRIRFYGLDHFLMGLSRPANVRSYKHRPCPPALHTMASAGGPSRVRVRSFVRGRAHPIVSHGTILSCLSWHSSCLSHRPISWYYLLQLCVSVVKKFVYVFLKVDLIEPLRELEKTKRGRQDKKRKIRDTYTRTRDNNIYI